jgi:4-hydroxy-3-methylbut-2-enyl diphosphate reductase IspH
MAAAWGFAGEGYAMEKAADRIGELELEVEIWKSRAIHQNEVAGRLEAKLAKAVEVIKAAAREHRVIAGMDMVGASSTAYNAAREAEATLAELTGDTND